MNLDRLEKKAETSRRTMIQLTVVYAIGLVVMVTRIVDPRTTLGAVTVTVMWLTLVLLGLLAAHFLFSLRPRILAARGNGVRESFLDRLDGEQRCN